MRKIFLVLAFFSFVNFTGFVSADQESIIIMTHDSFSASKKIIELFEKENNAKIEFIKTGDAGSVLNQAILTKNNPMADILFGVDNTFLSRALDADIFEAYNSSFLENIPNNLKLDSQNRLLPVDFGDVCLNYDKNWFAKKNIKPPKDLEDLTKPEYKNLLVGLNPATSSPGLAFMLATVGHFGENHKEDWLNYWIKLKENKILIVDGWKQAYWGQFSAASKGDKPIVISYATSPAAEVYFSKDKLQAPPTGIVLENKSSFRQIEFVGILKKTKKLKLAQKLVDFMLDKSFQEDIPLQMFVFPANSKANLPDVFKKHAQIAKDPMVLDFDKIAKNREKWITNWTEIILK